METPTELKHRLFKEAHAMVAYIADRGIDKELPDAALLSVLDMDPEERATLPMGDVMALHHALARMVSPAYPETIEKLHDHRNSDSWARWFAPLNSILWLMIISVMLVALLGYGLSQVSHVPLPAGYLEIQREVLGEANRQVSDTNAQNDTSGSEAPSSQQAATPKELPYFEPVIDYLQGKCRFSVEELQVVDQQFDDGKSMRDFQKAIREHDADCRELRRPILLRIFLFFGILGMLGAAYSSIYDSFSYIREGRYDMRLASTYYVRIFLGGFSGILLAEPLSGYLEQGVLSSALLAFIGGFSAQLVYDLLTKLVDSVANMFREDRRRERQSILAQAQYGAIGAIQQHDAMQRQGLAKLLVKAQNEPDPDVRARMMQDALLSIMSGEASARFVPAGTDTLVDQMQRVSLFVELSLHVAPLLPDAAAAADTAKSALADLNEALQAVLAHGDSPEAQTLARAALQRAQDADLVVATLNDALPALGDTLNGASLRAVAKGALATGSHLAVAAIQRWRHVAYRATKPTVTLLQDVDADQLAGALILPGGGEISAQDLLANDPETLFALPGGFADRETFDAAYEGWIDTAVRRVLAADWTAKLAHVTGSSLDGDAFVAALAQVQMSVTARGGLQKLELLGGAVTGTTDPDVTLSRLIARVNAQLTRETD